MKRIQIFFQLNFSSFKPPDVILSKLVFFFRLHYLKLKMEVTLNKCLKLIILRGLLLKKYIVIGQIRKILKILFKCHEF